jgi:hypothetical protein
VGRIPNVFGCTRVIEGSLDLFRFVRRVDEQRWLALRIVRVVVDQQQRATTAIGRDLDARLGAVEVCVDLHDLADSAVEGRGIQRRRDIGVVLSGSDRHIRRAVAEVGDSSHVVFLSSQMRTNIAHRQVPR